MKNIITKLYKTGFPVAFYSICRLWLFGLIVNDAILIVLGSLASTFITVRIFDAAGKRMGLLVPLDNSNILLAVEKTEISELIQNNDFDISSKEASVVLRDLAQKINITPFEQKDLSGLSAHLRIWPSTKKLVYQLVFTYFLKSSEEAELSAPLDFHWNQLLEQTEVAITQGKQGFEVQLAFPAQECASEKWIEYERLLENFALGSKDIIEYHLERAFPSYILVSTTQKQEIVELTNETSFSTDQLVSYISSVLEDGKQEVPMLEVS